MHIISRNNLQYFLTLTLRLHADTLFDINSFNEEKYEGSVVGSIQKPLICQQQIKLQASLKSAKYTKKKGKNGELMNFCSKHSTKAANSTLLQLKSENYLPWLARVSAFHHFPRAPFCCCN